ncbi:hypothetical protein LWI28_023739 [Acer negundo]|uniref:Uncharacterized protein n=1 Tax=Acer negundo TaxID=4023 RepID=A0AAD5J0X8_ACENE|nr:hypothetical protein LWI28_023739 [Acer negundo]
MKGCCSTGLSFWHPIVPDFHEVVLGNDSDGCFHPRIGSDCLFANEVPFDLNIAVLSGLESGFYFYLKDFPPRPSAVWLGIIAGKEILPRYTGNHLFLPPVRW